MGWKGILVGDVALGFPAILNRFTFFEVAGSLWRSRPITRVGLGTAAFELPAVGVRSTQGTVVVRRMSYLPLYLHVLPWMRCETWPIQPVSRMTFDGRNKTYYYNPSETVEKKVPATYLDIYAGGSLWATSSNDKAFFGRLSYLRVGARLVHQFRIEKKPMLLGAIWPLGLDVGASFTGLTTERITGYAYAAVTVGVGETGFW